MWKTHRVQIVGDPFVSHAHPNFAYEALASPTILPSPSDPGAGTASGSSWLSASTKLRRSATTKSTQLRNAALASGLVTRLKRFKSRREASHSPVEPTEPATTTPISPGAQAGSLSPAHSPLSDTSMASPILRTPVSPVNPVRSSSLYASRSFPPRQYHFTTARAAPPPPATPTSPTPMPIGTPAPNAPRSACTPLPPHVELDAPRPRSGFRPLSGYGHCRSPSVATEDDDNLAPFSTSRFRRPMALDLRSGLNRRSLTFDGYHHQPSDSTADLIQQGGEQHRDNGAHRASWAGRLVRRRDSSAGTSSGIYRRCISVGTMTTDHPDEDTGYTIRPQLNALGLDTGLSSRPMSGFEPAVDSVYITPFMPSPHYLFSRDPPLSALTPRNVRRSTEQTALLHARRERERVRATTRDNRPATILAVRAVELPPPTYDQAVSIASSPCTTSPGTPTTAMRTLDFRHRSLGSDNAVVDADRIGEQQERDCFAVPGWGGRLRQERAPELREYEKLRARNA